MGGVHFNSTGTPHVWRQPFPPNVQEDLTSFDNPKGHVTNSNLKQAGLIAQADLTSCVTPMTLAMPPSPMCPTTLLPSLSSEKGLCPLTLLQPTCVIFLWLLENNNEVQFTNSLVYYLFPKFQK